MYVRQSTPNQVVKNRESQQRQYALADRARELGWPDERIVVIDSDLGHSAASQGTRNGFEQVCEQVSRGQVGAIFGIEVSRLARNTVEWFQLLDLCRLNDTILVEDGQVYAPGRDDDGLILGIKGTFSAAELSVLRARMEGGRRSKAQRGELYASPPIGFVREGNSLRKDPDVRVRTAIETVFARFGEGGSGLQAARLLRSGGGAASKPAEECGNGDLEGHHLFPGDGDPEEPGHGWGLCLREGPAAGIAMTGRCWHRRRGGGC